MTDSDMLRTATASPDGQPASTARSIASASSAGKGCKHNILIVDTSETMLKALKDVFESDDFGILTANNVEEALRIIVETGVNLIISSYHIPGLTGIELLREVKRRHPDTIRIMLTGHADVLEVMGAIKEGILYKFILIPWNDDDLKLTISQALAQQQLIEENKKLKRIAQQHADRFSKLKRFANVDRTALGSILVEKRVLLPAQLEMVMKYREQKNIILAKAIVELGMIDESKLVRLIQKQSKAEVVLLDEKTIDRGLSRILSREVCEAGCMVPLCHEENSLHLAMADPTDLSRVEHVGFTARATVVPFIATVGAIERAIKRIHGDADGEIEVMTARGDQPISSNEIDIILEEEEKVTLEQLMAKTAMPPAVKTVNTIIAEAINVNASDIHIEPRTNDTVVRYRIDGILRDGVKVPVSLHLTMVSRIKILAKMDIAERRIPQDGRITVKVKNITVDIRVSSMPTINGEKIVCRLLCRNASVWSLEEIGIGDEPLECLKTILHAPQGMIIATGPTGSGKTTSLYGMLTMRDSESLSLTTIEDPVEYQLERASQVHVHRKAGLTFASALRSTLRQDPDLIMVGEIRDMETATAAFQAAMTGHLVFTTLHTNSTVATISRLFHLGVEPYLVASAVQAILAQRLVRAVCPHCSEEREYDGKLLKLLGGAEADFPGKLSYGTGCAMCDQTGYRGRLGLFELFQMNAEFRCFLTTNYHETELLSMATSLGMRTLLEDGLGKIADGRTTLEEVLRVLGPAMDQ